MKDSDTHAMPSPIEGVGRWIFWGFLLIAAYFLLTEHRAHVVPYLPFVLLLACPLLHMFHGHGGHGGHGGDQGHEVEPQKQLASGGAMMRIEEAPKKTASGSAHHH